MNQLLLCSIFFIFLKFTKENIEYHFSKECMEIEKVIDGTITLSFSDSVINTEYCNRHNTKLNGNKCCNVILENDKETKDFCGIITSDEYNNISQAIERINKASPNYGEIKIDCFSKNLYFVIIILVICFIFLI